MQYSRRLWQVASAQGECSDAPSCEISKASSISAARYECQECLKVLIPLFTLQTKNIRISEGWSQAPLGDHTVYPEAQNSCTNLY